jgi:hypothetical protein
MVLGLAEAVTVRTTGNHEDDGHRKSQFLKPFFLRLRVKHPDVMFPLTDVHRIIFS